MAAAAPAPLPAVEAKQPLWKNPFAIGFVIGIVALTALPLLQRRVLRAPPPLRSLGAWSLQSSDGGAFGSEQLKGRVWIAGFAPSDCSAACLLHLGELGRVLPHLDDLGDKVVVVTLLGPVDGGHPRSLGQRDRWLTLSGPVMGGFREGFQAFLPGFDAGVTADEFAGARALALVDQDGALRGFWHADELGRGNVINAARLLAKYGPKP